MWLSYNLYAFANESSYQSIWGSDEQMTTSIKIDNTTALTLEEAEIYCALKMKDDVANEQQRQVALQLANIFDTGREDVISNEWKAQQYLAFATKSAKTEKGLLSDDKAFELLNWFTSTRLALVRANREVVVLDKKPFLPVLFSIGGLSYFIELVIDLYQVFKLAFNPRSQLERNLGFAKRLNNAFNEDGRVSRMTNALLWFGVNFTCLILTLGLSELAKVTVKLVTSVLNLAGFSIDVAHDAGFAFANYKRNARLLDKMNSKIQTLEFKNYLTPDEAKELDHLRRTIKPQLEERVKTGYAGFLRTSFVTIGLVIGMGLILFPPTSLAGAVIIGSTMALGIGSGVGGLGRRLWLLCQKGFNAVKNSLVTPADSAKDKDVLTLKVPESKPLLSGPEQDTGSPSSTASTMLQLSNSTILTPTPTEDPLPMSRTSSPVLFESAPRVKRDSVLAKDIMKRIETLDRLAVKSTLTPHSENSISRVLSAYHPDEIQEIRSLLGLTDDTSWNKQVSYWLHFYVNPKTHDYSEHQLYKGSLRFALFQRIKEERNLMNCLENKAMEQPEKTKLENEFESGTEVHTLRSVSIA